MAAEALTQVFSALADPTRRDIVERLSDGDATLTELAAHYDVSVQAVSKHLKVLGAAGLVERAGESQRSPLHLDAEVFDLMTKWIERYRRQAEERYRRLDALLAEMPDEGDSTTTTNDLRRLGDEESGFHGSFQEVRPSELIVQTFTFEGVPDGVALERMTLIPLEGGRTRLESTSLVGGAPLTAPSPMSAVAVGVALRPQRSHRPEWQPGDRCTDPLATAA